MTRMTVQYFFILLKSFSISFFPLSSCHFLAYLVNAFFLDRDLTKIGYKSFKCLTTLVLAFDLNALRNTKYSNQAVRQQFFPQKLLKIEELQLVLNKSFNCNLPAKSSKNYQKFSLVTHTICVSEETLVAHQHCYQYIGNAREEQNNGATGDSHGRQPGSALRNKCHVIESTVDEHVHKK